MERYVYPTMGIVEMELGMLNGIYYQPTEEVSINILMTPILIRDIIIRMQIDATASWVIYRATYCMSTECL